MRPMCQGEVFVHKRINITLPEETIEILDRVTKKRGRSELIDRAIISYISGIGKKNIRTQLKEGYERHARHDLEMAQEWFSLEEEAWNADKEGRA